MRNSFHRLRIVLVAPRIALNVGNVARTAKALGAELHLVKPFGFVLDPKKLKRSSVGYFEDLEPIVYSDAEDFWKRFSLEDRPETAYFWATKRGSKIYTDLEYPTDAVLIFGNEEEGVDASFFRAYEVIKKGSESGVLKRVQACRIPTQSVRCLNLATSVGIIAFEVYRQWGKKTPLEEPGVDGHLRAVIGDF